MLLIRLSLVDKQQLNLNVTKSFLHFICGFDMLVFVLTFITEPSVTAFLIEYSVETFINPQSFTFPAVHLFSVNFYIEQRQFTFLLFIKLIAFR